MVGSWVMNDRGNRDILRDCGLKSRRVGCIARGVFESVRYALMCALFSEDGDG